MRRVRRQQRGIVAVVVALAMLVLLVMAGFAIDTGHLALDKSRLQSSVDAAALAAAKSLDTTGDTPQGREDARIAAGAVFGLNASGFDKGETLGNLDVQFSHTLDPFVDGTSPAEYVRVIASDYSVTTSLTQLLGYDEFLTRASAVAGPSAPIVNPCDLFPVAVCADLTKGPPFWGYIPYGQAGNTVKRLKLGSHGEAEEKWDQGTGLFHMIELGGTGKKTVRENMAGGAACLDLGGFVRPEPGNASSVRQGFNTRFGIGSDATYPPDLVVTPAPAMPLSWSEELGLTFNGAPISSVEQIGYSYADYLDDYSSKNYTHGSTGKAQRRLVNVPIVDCTNLLHGSSGLLPVKGFGSFFVLQPMDTGVEAWIFGQFLGEGRASGSPGQQGGTGLYKIVLHDDPNSPDS